MTALLVGGQGSYATLSEEQMETAFGGYFRPYDQRVSVPFPGDADFSKSIPEGATNLYNAVVAAKTDNPDIVLTIGGVSKGAPSVLEALRQLEATREAGGTVPDADHMNVMIYGAPSRIYYAGVKYRPDIPVTPYDVYMVSAEYDGVADMPDNMFNILAVLNAMQGADLLHVDAAFNTDFENDPMRYKVEQNADGGTVTTILIPYNDPILPLLHPMLEAGADPAQLAKMSAMLKPIIDSAYKRNNVIEKKKWQTGIVTIPLPDAAPSSINGTLKVSVPIDDSQDSVKPAERKTLSDYVGKHRAPDTDDDGADTTKVKKNVLKDLSDSIKTEVKKLTTKKDKKDTKETAPEKQETAGAPSSSDSGTNSAGSES
ncbi:MAG: PE-PPE domain-containing protein [Mycobacterium kyogaense]|uniref:PE-PPE domain-containing protein n=1 Tax=Mycobacterium kyogaense TaxID=2212479 RepID=UPI002FF4A031